METALRKRKVLIVLRELGVGGAEKVLVNVANNLSTEEFDVTIAFVEDGSYRTLVKEHVELVQFHSKSPLGVAFEIRKLVIERDYDVVLFSWLKPMVFVHTLNLFRNMRVRTVFRVPISLQSQMRTNPLYNNFLFKKLISRVLSRADSLIALCDGMKEELVKYFGIDERKVRVIPNPVNIDYIVGKASEFNPFELESEFLHIVSAGRLEYQKGFDVLLKAFKVVADRFPNAVLTIIGKGSLDGKLRRLARELGLGRRVRFVDWVSNPYPYFKHADLFVLSSRFEGFPNVILEALACGTKVVATDCKTGPKEILGEREEYGWLAKTEDPKSLAEKMEEAINSPKKRVEGILERFSLENAVRSYQEVIREVVKPRVLVLLSELGHGGAQRVALTVARYLAAYETKVTVVAMRDGDYREYLEGSEVETVVLNVPRARDSVLKVYSIMRKLQPDVVFATLIQDWYVASLVGALLYKKPKFLFRLSMDVEVLFRRSVNNFFGRLVLAKADKIVTQTERMELGLESRFKAIGNKVVTIGNPVDVDYVEKKSVEFDPFVNFRNEVKIVSAGRLVYQKGFDVLLKAFNIVRESVPNVRLFILGDGAERDNLESLARELRIEDFVNFVGWVSNPYPYFRLCDVFVLPSRYEGMPNVLLEALACGTKVVATDCPTGPREILGVDGQCGWLVPVDDYEALAKAILAALRSDSKSSKTCVERFSARSVAQIYRGIVRELTGW